MNLLYFKIFFVIFGCIEYSNGSITEFNDRLVYDISWNGPLSDQAEKQNTLEKVVITTNQNEKYQCLIPEVTKQSKDFDLSDGPAPEHLLSDLLTSTPRKCSYRLEPYWTYEVCHGKSVIQFHEEKDKNGKVKRIEYILGKMTDKEAKDLVHETMKPLQSPEAPKKPETKRIEGKDTPYYSVDMGNGTPCDLSGNPRRSSVLYVCNSASNNEVLSVKEVRTCEYEVIVLSPVICANPAFLMLREPVNDIQCHALPGSPSRPLSLMADYKDVEVFLDGTYRQRNIIRKLPQKELPKEPVKPSMDLAINRQFLHGDYCLVGGSGWWNYEFCNGKYVQQFHEEPMKSKIIIKLGYWNKEEHIKMVKKGAIVPKGDKHVMHYYMGGDVCDLTGKPRQATVILTCIEGTGQQLGIYMTEQQPCEYTIGVESPILCPFVAGADENGLFDHVMVDKKD